MAVLGEYARSEGKRDVQNGREPAQEKLVVALLLALVGGFLDVYTYILHGQVFANAQTGNMVLMSMHLAAGEWEQAFRYLLPIGFFALGVAVSELVNEKLHRKGGLGWRQQVVLLEFLLLLLLGAGLMRGNSYIVNCIVTCICAMQVTAFKKVWGTPYATTMCTGNLRSASECFTRYLLKKDKRDSRHSLAYMLVILTFCGGAVAGVFLVNWLRVRSVWICCLLLMMVFLYLHKNREEVNG